MATKNLGPLGIYRQVEAEIRADLQKGFNVSKCFICDEVRRFPNLITTLNRAGLDGRALERVDSRWEANKFTGYTFCPRKGDEHYTLSNLLDSIAEILEPTEQGQ